MKYRDVARMYFRPQSTGTKPADEGTTLNDVRQALTEWLTPPQMQAIGMAGADIARRLGVDIPTGAEDAVLGRTNTDRMRRMLSGYEGGAEYLLRGAGALAKGYADNADARNNPNGVDNPVTDASAMRTVGDGLDWLADVLREEQESPIRQRAFHEKKKDYGTFADMISDGTLGEYLTDPGGAKQNIDTGVGNALFFLTLAKAFPTLSFGGKLEQGVSGALGSGIANTTRGLLGKAGLHNAARIAGGKSAEGLLSSAIEFAPTMGLGQAIVNAGSIVDPLRQQGYSDAEIYNRQKDLIADELPADMAFAALTGNVLKGNLGRAIAGRNASIPKLAAAQLPGLGLETTGGFYSNLYQMMLANQYSGKPYGELFGEHTPEEAEAANIGAFVGGFFGAHGIPSAVHGTRRAEAYGKRSQDVADRYHGARDEAPEIARQAYRDAADERIYWGNGGKDEGKTWFRQGDNVSLNGAQPDLMNAIDSLADWLYKKTGRRLVVTSGTNGDHPSNSSEHGHSSGWKVDVVDEYNDGEDSDLITADFQKGRLADEFIAYGRSLGLGMNFEGAGTDNVHFDVALDGTQWDGYGEDAGGFRGGGKQIARTEQETGGKKSSSIDNFMRAIVQQESGGDYDLTNPDSGAAGAFQIMPENWSAWAQDAGLPADAPMTSENQNIVARHKMLEYYNKFGNWRDVAIAWYGGEGAVSYSEEAKARPQYSNGQEYPSINEYADSVMSHFENFGGEQEQSVQSRADELFAQRFQDRMNPSQQQQRIPEPEPIKTRYVDTRAEDDATQKLFDQFAQERLAKAVESKNVDENSFWSRMFNDDSTFNNTKENRDAIREHYGEDLSQFIAKTFDAAETPEEQPAHTQQAKPQPKQTQQPAAPVANNKANNLLRNNDVIQAGRSFLEELNATGKQEDAVKAFSLLQAIQNNDEGTIRNILKENGRENLIQQAQQESKPQPAQQEQQGGVKENTTPENVLEQAQPQETAKPAKQKTTKSERAANLAAKPIKSERSKLDTRIRQGNAMLFVADENGIEVPVEDRNALTKGNTKKLHEWQLKLANRNLIPAPKRAQTQPAQTTEQQPSQQAQTQPTQPTTEQPKSLVEQAKAIVQEATDAAQKNWDEIKQGYKERGEPLRSQKEAEKLRQNEEARLKRQAEHLEQLGREKEQRRLEREERERQAKQANELAELQTRQAEEKRNAEERQRQDTEREAEMARRESLPTDISNALAPASSNNVARQHQGNAIADLVNSKPFQDMYGTIMLPNGLEQSLRRGDKDAIKTAQQLMQRRNVRPVEWAAPDNPAPIDDGSFDNAETQSQQTPQEQQQEPQKPRQDQREETATTYSEPDRVPQADADRTLATTPVANNPREAKAQGAAILRLINSPQFKATYGNAKFSEPLVRALRDGKAKGIEQAQRLLAERGVTRQAEQEQLKPTEQPRQEQERPKPEAKQDNLGKLRKILQKAKTEVAKIWEVAPEFYPHELFKAWDEMLDKFSERSKPLDEDAFRIYKNMLKWIVADERAAAKEQHSKPERKESPPTAKSETKLEPKAEQKPQEKAESETKSEPKAEEKPQEETLRGESKPKAEQKSQETKPETESKATTEAKPKEEPQDKEEPKQKEKPKTEPEAEKNETKKEKTKLADILKKRLLERTPLDKYPAVKELIFGRIDEQANTTDESVSEFKAWCKRYLELFPTEEQWFQQMERAQTGGAKPPKPKEPPKSKEQKQSEAEKKIRKQAAELKKLLTEYLSLDKYPHFKAATFDLIDRTVAFTIRQGNASKFGGWCKRYMASTRELVKEKGGVGSKELEKYCEQQERFTIETEQKKVREAQEEERRQAELDALRHFVDDSETDIGKIKDAFVEELCKMVSPQHRQEAKKWAIDIANDFVNPATYLKDFKNYLGNVLVSNKEGNTSVVSHNFLYEATADALYDFRGKHADVLRYDLPPAYHEAQNLHYQRGGDLEATYDRVKELLAQAEKELSNKQKPKEDVAPKETTEAKQDETTEKTPTEESKPAEKDNAEDAESGQAQKEKVTPKEAAAKYNEGTGKRQKKGKWHTVGSAGSREALQDSIRKHYYNDNLVIEDDGTVRDPTSGKELGYVVRNYKGRWQLGEYENTSAKSTEGGADTRIINLIEDDSKLTPQQKLLKDFAAKLGVPIQFFDNPDGRFHGAFTDGITFLNVNSKKGLGGVFWHESFHWLKANNPELYAKLVDAAEITQAQRDAFLERTGRNDLTTDEAIDEEILADQMDDVAKRTGLLQSLAGKNRGVVERVVQWLKDTMNKFIETFRNPTGRLTTKQAQALAGEFGKIARSLKDANGNQIFRVSNRTGNIEVIGGRTVPQTTTAKATAAAQSTAAKYSIDPADNSNESWGRRLKNWTAGLTGSKKSPDRIHQEMKQRLMDLSNMKIAAGHLPKGVQESIDEVARVIRTKREYDWAKILPHVGNSVAAQLGITQSVEMSNCIAKYLHDGVVDKQSAEGKEFIQAMRNNEEMRDKIIATQEVFGRWRDMDDVQKQVASIQFGKPQENLTLKERGVKFWRELRRQLFDAQAPIGYQVEHFEKATGMKLANSINPEVAFRRLHGTQGLAKDMIDGGRTEVKVLQGYFAGVNFDNFQTVAETLHMAGAFESDQNYKEFANFVTIKQILTLHKHNDNNRATQAEIRKKIAQLKEDLEFAGTKKERTRIEQAIERRERALSDLQDSVKELPEAWDTKEKCEKGLAKLTAKHGDKFEKAQKALVEYTKVLMAMRVDAGLMSVRRFNELLNAFPDYVPLHRIFDENPDLEADSDKHMVGSGKDIIDPIQAIMDNTFDIVHRCEKNKAKQMLATLARFDGVGRIFEEVEPGSNDGTIINFYEGGKRKCLQCADPALVKAVNNLAPAPMNWAMKLFRVPTLVLKGATTAWSPAFMARNMFRDPQDAYVYSAKNGGNVFKDALKYMTPLFALKCTFDTLCGNSKTYEALINKLNMEVDKELLAEYRIYGGSQSTFFDFDADVKADLFAKYTKGKWKRFASPKGVIQLLEKLGELSERGTRLQRFKQVKDNLKAQHGGINIYDDLVTAAFESRDLMDFARHGEAGHTWNTMAAFANPALQGIDKLIRTFDVKKLKMFGGTEETQKQWMSSLARLAIGSILPALVLTMLHKDEDWYKDDLQPWEKDAYWILGENLKIPKGADVATRFFSNLTEALVNSDNEPIKAKRILMPLYDGLPNLLPTAMAPVIECFFNKDLFKGTPIIPMRERYLSATPEKQYDSSNSNFAIWLGNKLGVSPRQIDHMIYGYTGNLGKGFMKTIDTGLHATGLSDKPVQPWTQAWIPVVGGFLREPYANSKIVKDYYTELDQQRSYVEAYKDDKKNRKKDAKLDENFDRGWYARLTGAEKAMGEFAKRERAILDNPNLTSEQVEEQRRKIQEKRIALLRRIFKYKRAQ